MACITPPLKNGMGLKLGNGISLVSLLFCGLRQAIPKSYLYFREIFASCVIEIDAFIASFPGLREDLGTKLLSP